VDGGTIKVLRNTGNNEWFTPNYIVEAARKVMGHIDLDPASCQLANERHVCADTFYDATNDGLDNSWFGRVWMNPPYSGGLLPKFIDKLELELSVGNVKQATVLVNNGTETRWCQKLFTLANAACFVSGRIKFYRADGTTGPPLQGQVVFFLGQDTARFVEVFSALGAAVLIPQNPSQEVVL
jgi:ParB family chromosome partitioning protein